jgi:hypothetical protein
MVAGAPFVVTSAHARFARLTMPPSLPSRTTGMRSILFVSSELGRIADHDDIARHGVPDRAAVPLNIVARKLPIRRDPPEPPWPAAPHPSFRSAQGPGLDAVQHVSLADDADHAIVGIDDGDPVDPTSERSAANARIDVYGSTETPSVVITSAACIATSLPCPGIG